jgi:RHS repeat-associated protein
MGQDFVPLGFPGQIYDPETGFYYNFQRYYDPETSRYLSQDPLRLAAGPNPQSYAPNPVTWLDPLGLMACFYDGSRIDAFSLNYTNTVQDHSFELTKKGDFARPYNDSRIFIQEIVDSKNPLPDPQGVPNQVRWDVPGSLNGSNGNWELVINTKTNTVMHFVFKKVKVNAG